MLKFEGHVGFRQRLIMATISGKAIKIEKIRSDDDNPGLRDFEANFLRLLEKVTNGSLIEINYTGTAILYKPGIIVGGKIEHDCGLTRSIGYFLESMVMLAPFSKLPFVLTLQGITNDNLDISVDLLRTVTLRQLNKFGIEDGVELKITKRGAPPLGGGEVLFKCTVVRSLKPIRFIDEGRIKRIRGIAYSTRVSPQTANRVVESARSVLNRYIPDIYIYTDVYKGKESGKSPGYGLTLVAESTTECLLSAECFADVKETPEDLGKRVARMLLQEIQEGGCIDTYNHGLNLLFMVLGPEDVSKLRIGKLTPFCIEILRDIKQFFNITYKVVPDDKNKTILLTCMGTGFTNVSKKTN
ncbi:18S rRNA biogenesis protein [Neoconidiobolus thromboides FSU 785]|nr:18S rRNA biogenesis protein [Neoconidiobolus thromboides FSU 785]